MDIKTYMDLNGEPNIRSYGILTKDEVSELDKIIKEDQVLISHVGDGEYANNIFGNVFSNYTKAIESYKADFENHAYLPNDEYIVTLIQEFWKGEPLYLYVGRIHNGYANANVWPFLVGLLTIQTINDTFNGGQ